MVSTRLARPEERSEIGEWTYKLFSDRSDFDEKAFSMSEYGINLRDVVGRAEAAECIAVAIVEGKIVGCVDYHRNYAKQDFRGLGKLAIDPDIRKGGIGQLLVKCCIERAIT